MDKPTIEQQDCSCRLVHSDSHDPIADCTECGGLGTIDTDAPGPHLLAPDDDDAGWVGHWHSGPIGADQFCRACDVERRSGRAA